MIFNATKVEMRGNCDRVTGTGVLTFVGLQSGELTASLSFSAEIRMWSASVVNELMANEIKPGRRVGAILSVHELQRSGALAGPVRCIFEK